MEERPYADVRATRRLAGCERARIDDVPGEPLRVHVELRAGRSGCETCGVLAHVKDRPVSPPLRASGGPRICAAQATVAVCGGFAP